MLEFLDIFIKIFQENPIAQTLGFLAVFVNIIAFVTAKDKIFLIFMAISSLVWGLHFYYMGLLAAAFVSFFDILKNIIALKFKRNNFLMTFFIISYLIIGFFTFSSENLLTLIPIFNSIFSVFLIFYLKGPKLKIGFLIILCFWFIYNFFGNSLGGMISDIILFISGIIGIINILIENKNKNLQKNID